MAKLSKTKSKSDLPPLSPEAEAALQSQVEVVAAACEVGREVERLRTLVTPNPDDPIWDQHLITALANLRYPAVPFLLAALFGESRDKERRKALKRALHFLKTRGVPVSEELLPREEPEFGKMRPPEVKSLASPVFGNGESYLVLECPREVLGGNFLVARLSDLLGLQECHLLNLKSQQQPELWDYYRQHGLTEWYAVPGPYAVRLLEEAYAGKTAVPEATRAYSALREKIVKHWGSPEAAQEPEQLLPPLDDAEQSRLLEKSRELAINPVFQTWMPALEEIAPWLDKFLELEGSPLVLTEPQKQARTEALLDEATRTLYPPEARPRWRRRLLTMAYYLGTSGHLLEARLAQAAAADLGNAESSAMAGENPYLKSLVQLGLSLAYELKQKSQEAQSPSGLLTLPGDPRLRR